MTLKLLSLDEIEYVYNTYMKNDFPPRELKPLEIILNAINEGIYECYGLCEEQLDESCIAVGDELVECFEVTTNIWGYAFVEKIKESSNYLIDYLAVADTHRNQGLGALIIKLLSDKLDAAESVIGEVEDPNYAENEEERSLQQRRYDFYLRNGFVDAKVNAICFGVHFKLIELIGESKRKAHNKLEIEELYKLQYKSMLPKEMYEKNVFIEE